MSEELLKELLEEVKKHNEIQENIKREMEMQNNLTAYDMVENKDNFISDIEGKIKNDVYEDLRPKKKSNVKSGGGYLDSNFNELLNTMREGFEEDTRNESMTSLCETVISMIKSGILTNEDAQFIVLTTGRNSKPPMPDKEIETCWNSILRKENQN